MSNDLYMTQEEMQELSRLLEFKDAMKDTIACWKRTRILGVSASLACEGNVSVPLLRAFDEIREALEPKE